MRLINMLTHERINRDWKQFMSLKILMQMQSL